MAALAEHIDRLSHIAQSIRAASSPALGRTIPGPFTRAILDTPLGDLIRDIDPSEIGLFTLVQPQRARGRSRCVPESLFALVRGRCWLFPDRRLLLALGLEWGADFLLRQLLFLYDGSISALDAPGMERTRCLRYKIWD